MPSLDTVTFHKFRGLHNLSLEGLGKINLLVGINNSGKTSILEGLSIYTNPFNIMGWWTILSKREREDHFTRSSVIDSMRWLFPQTPLILPNDLQTTTVEDYGDLWISSHSKDIFPISSLAARYDVVEEFRSPQRGARRVNKSEREDKLELTQGLNLQVEVQPEIAFQLSLPLDGEQTDIEKISFQVWDDESPIRLPRTQKYRTPVGLVTTTSHRSEAHNISLFSEAQYGDFKEEVINLLQEIDSNITDIQILSERGSIIRNRVGIQIKHEKLGFAPLASFGDGIRRLFHIALKLPRIKGGILLIDEVESAIHTEALQSSYKWLVKWCTDMDIQVFATTHSLEAVDALLEVTKSDDQFVLYRLEQSRDKTHVVRHGWERLKILREELGQEVRW